MRNTENKFAPEIVFPNDLNPKDVGLILEQCEIQGATSKEQVEGFANAYLRAKKLALDNQQLNNLTPSEVENLILELGALVEKQNKKGFRQTPASFKDGRLALDANKIPQAIKSFCQGFLAFLENPTEDERLNTVLLYTEFEKIHPFEDGNGRVGDLLWKMLETKKSRQWPQTLPPDVFNEELK